MPEIKYANAAELLPIQMVLGEYMSPKKVANVFTSQGIPVKIIGQSNSYLPFSHLCGVYEHAARSLGEANLGVYCGAKWGSKVVMESVQFNGDKPYLSDQIADGEF